jgi:hypothetical protein
LTTGVPRMTGGFGAVPEDEDFNFEEFSVYDDESAR